MSHSIPNTPARSPVDAMLGEGWAQAYVEAAVDAVILIDEFGSVRYMNASACRLFGYEAAACIGKNVSMFMGAPHQDAHDGYLSRYLREGNPRIIGLGRAVDALRSDGGSVPVYLSVCEALVDGQRMFVGSIHDQSEQQQAEREKDRALLALHARNIELTCLFRIGQITREMVRPQEILSAIARELPSAFPGHGGATCRIQFDGDHYVSDAFGESPFILSANIVVSDRVRGVIVMFLHESEASSDRDATNLLDAIARLAGEAVERYEAEAQIMQASKLASIGELAAGVGHEINNPVNGIMNCAEILLETLGEGTSERQFAELIHQEADRIAKIVRTLLSFSRQNPDSPETASVADLAKVVLSLSRNRIETSNIHLSVSIPDSLPPIRCRSEQLHQVLLNLILNAVHALDGKPSLPANGKRLALTAALIYREGREFVRISVADRGTGIAPEHVKQIFDPFFTTKGRDKGTGLGLSICHSIVKSHGGDITVDSELGIGSTFHVNLPIDGTPAMGDEGTQ